MNNICNIIKLIKEYYICIIYVGIGPGISTSLCTLTYLINSLLWLDFYVSLDDTHQGFILVTNVLGIGNKPTQFIALICFFMIYINFVVHPYLGIAYLILCNTYNVLSCFYVIILFTYEGCFVVEELPM